MFLNHIVLQSALKHNLVHLLEEKIMDREAIFIYVARFGPDLGEEGI